MKHNTVVILLLTMAAALLAVGCNKDDNKDDNKQKTYPSTMPAQKVTRIWQTTNGRTDMKNPITGDWMTLVNKTGERQVGYEFTWNGDRIERIVTLTSEYTMDYDEYGWLSTCQEHMSRESSDMRMYFDTFYEFEFAD